MVFSDKNLSLFNRSISGAVIVFAVFTMTFILYVRSEKAVDTVKEQRFISHQLADNLRQSSDDLTRMVRTYVLTGNPIYKHHYQEILDIRNGHKPRPMHYEHIYWDLVLSDDKRPFPMTSESVSLLALMQKAGFTPQEFAKLSEAKKNSDELTKLEFDAMKIVESTTPATDKSRHIAFIMLHDDTYHKAKYHIMKPISDAHLLMDQRTLKAVDDAQQTATYMRIAFIVFGLILVSMLWSVYRSLQLTLGGSLELLHYHISKIGQGDLSSPIIIPKGTENSILAWLAHTQTKLAKIDTERTHAQKEAHRMRDLYAALSQCNQAIIRCQDEMELFETICNDAVIYGGMKMAWIGSKDDQIQELKVMAYAGEGSSYLNDLHISLNPTERSSQGPTGTAFRTDFPFWCQDFPNDPRTAQWHAKGAQFGWGSSASIPLHRNGTPYAMFTIYAAETNAFDEAAKKLLLEMAGDIDYALANFDRNTARMQAENALMIRTQAIEQSPNSIIITDFKANIQYVNTAFTENTGYALAEVLGQNPRLLKSGNTPEHAYDAMWEALVRQEKWQGEFINKRKDGTNYIYSINVAPVLDIGGKTTHYIAIEEDISEQKKIQEKIHYLANFDPLTGLPNRIQMDDHLNYTLNLTKRNKGSFGIMFLDLDHFKNINDTLGHSIGDHLLIQLAQRLTTELRDEDTVSRMGGDEFIILLPDTDGKGAAQVAHKLLESIADPFMVEEHSLTVSASIGIALYPSDGTEIEILSKNADTAMYRAKQEGRNTYRFFTEEMQQDLKRTLLLSNALHTALARNELHLVYQPQLSAAKGTVIGVEALIRWNHPQLGFISPAEFIPIAEDNGMILPIGEWVMRTAVQQAYHWNKNGTDPIIMAVNLSAVQFRHPTLPDVITAIIKDVGLNPQLLEIELTEGVAMHDPKTAISIMNTLHDIGIRMSIDDFGTGYSSLAYLKQFKIYKLKIDQSFVRDITTNPEDKAIVSAVIQMAHSLGLTTIAEGVETLDQLDYLRQQGCDEIQGYYYSKPLPSTLLEEYLRTHQP